MLLVCGKVEGPSSYPSLAALVANAEKEERSMNHPVDLERIVKLGSEKSRNTKYITYITER